MEDQTTDRPREPKMTVTDAFTTATRNLIALAEELGLRPEARPAHRGVIRVMLNGRGEAAGFGSIEIGARTGKVIRMRLWRGNVQADLPASRVTTTGYQRSRIALEEYRTYVHILSLRTTERPPMVTTSGSAVWGQLPTAA